MYPLYTAVVTTSFGRGLEEEIEGVISVMDAMIVAKQPLNNDALLMLPGVRNWDTLGLIRSLVSVIESGSILRFHHCSFEDFLLSASFRQEFSKMSAVQNQNLHERQLAILCLNIMVLSELHFDICNLYSSSVMNVDIPAAVKSVISPCVSYACQFWADHLVHTSPEEKFMEVVKFVMYEKLFFWMEVMSLLGGHHGRKSQSFIRVECLSHQI